MHNLPLSENIKNKSSAVAERGDRLATIVIWPNSGGGAAVPLSVGAGGASPSNVAWAEAYLLTSGILIHPVVWLRYTWAEKWGTTVPFRGGSSSSNTMWRGPRPTSEPCGILIHPAVRHNRNAPKIGGAVPPFWKANWVPI